MRHILRLVARERFEHAGNVVWPFQEYDPRMHLLSPPDVHLDLRKCQFIMPSAVLWCVIYGLLSKRADNECVLLVPEDDAVCVYLKSLGLFGIIQDQGISVDDRDIRQSLNAQVLVPLTRFDTESQAEALANKALETLEQSGYGSANLYPLVSEVFAELAMNAVQHSESSVGAYGLVQFYEGQTGRRFVCSVADGGIGIRRSLERNPELRDRVPYDWVAVELAIKERVSGTSDPKRGIGLYGVAEDMRKAGRSLIVHSGKGAYRMSEELESRAWRTNLFPGTIVSTSIPC